MGSSDAPTPAGALAMPHPYWIVIDMFIDTESLDPEGARQVREAYSDPVAADRFWRGLVGLPNF